MGYHRGHRRAAHAQGRKPEAAVDQRIVQQDVGAAHQECNEHRREGVLYAAQEAHRRVDGEEHRDGGATDAEVGDAQLGHVRARAHDRVELGGKQEKEEGHQRSAGHCHRQGVPENLAAERVVARPVLAGHEAGGAEDEEREDPAHRADETGGDGLGRQRLHPQVADHGRVGDVQDGLAGNGERGRNGQSQQVPAVRRRSCGGGGVGSVRNDRSALIVDTDARGGAVEAPPQPALERIPRGWNEHQEAAGVREDARRDEQQSRYQDDHPVHHLLGRNDALVEIPLDLAQGPKTLQPGEKRPQRTGAEHQQDGVERADDCTHLDQEVELDQGNHGEQQQESREHAFSLPQRVYDIQEREAMAVHPNDPQ